MSRATRRVCAMHYETPCMTWVYIAGWWDGPLDGMVQTADGERLWATLVKENPPDPRIYDVYRMPADWMAAEVEKHKLWLECCGNFSYDKPKGWATTRPLKDFYDAYPPGDEVVLVDEVLGIELVCRLAESELHYPTLGAK